jgi:hypothetical protein
MSRNALLTAAWATALIGTPLLASDVAGQTLKAEPVLFSDPVPGHNPADGQLTLGRTTLSGALHMLAEVLAGDSVRVPRLHQANPSTLSNKSDWTVGTDTVRPRFRLDLGPARYVLYFDANQRLIAALSSRPDRRVHRRELTAHYANLQVQRRWHSGDVPSMDDMVAPLGPCLWYTADVRLPSDQVEQFGYVYTCKTIPSPKRSEN